MSNEELQQILTRLAIDITEVRMQAASSLQLISSSLEMAENNYDSMTSCLMELERDLDKLKEKLKGERENEN